MNKNEEALLALAHYSGFLYTLPKMSLEEAMVTMEELVDKETSKKSTIYGYDVGLLAGIAMELAEQGITYDMLKNSTDMYRKGFDDCSERYSILHKLIFKEEE